MNATRTSPAPSGPDADRRVDGRDARWAEHRRARRAALVDSTLRAVRRHGAGVGMDEIAHEAGTSKSVLYRHFDDKAGLYLAVAAQVDGLVRREVQRALAGGALVDGADGADARAPRSVVEASIAAYLQLVEHDPEVYRFVVARPLLDAPVPDDPVRGLTASIAADVAALLPAGDGERDGEVNDLVAQGLVGLVQAAADRWLATDPQQRVPTDRLAHRLADFAWNGLATLLEETP